MCGLNQFSEDAVKMTFAGKGRREAEDLGNPEDTDLCSFLLSGLLKVVSEQ